MSQNQQFLLDGAPMLVDKALKAGADAADAVVARSQSTSVSVRLGKVEGTDASESDDFSLRVFVGKRVASVSANAAGDPAQLAERAVGMARVAPEDPYAGLADEARLATQFPDLDLADTAAPDSARLTSDALAMEEAALAVPGVANSVGAGASSGSGGMVLVTSHGFAGAYNATRYSRSVSVLAGEGTKMERDYDFSSRLFFDELEKPQTIGKSAGERAVRRLNPRKMSTQTVACVFDPRASRGLVGHLAGAINGASVARKTSFLRDFLGKPVMAPGIRVTDNPLIRRGPSSRPFDGEGVSGEALTLVEDGVLQTWLLSTSAAKQLG
nr:TldD/PmbA family protein [Rhizobiaceae bacterium]